jgi:aryl-alcohol dehydrogenase-like predicted oxidoreductase
MELRRLGRTRLELSRIGLGCGNFGGIGSAPELFGEGETREQAFELMDAAWAAGVASAGSASGAPTGRRRSC